MCKLHYHICYCIKEATKYMIQQLVRCSRHPSCGEAVMEKRSCKYWKGHFHRRLISPLAEHKNAYLHRQPRVEGCSCNEKVHRFPQGRTCLGKDLVNLELTRLLYFHRGEGGYMFTGKFIHCVEYDRIHPQTDRLHERFESGCDFYYDEEGELQPILNQWQSNFCFDCREDTSDFFNTFPHPTDCLPAREEVAGKGGEEEVDEATGSGEGESKENSEVAQAEDERIDSVRGDEED